MLHCAVRSWPSSPPRPASLASRGSLPLAISTSLYRPSPCTPFRPPKDPPVRVFAFVRPSPSCQGWTPGQRNSLAAKTCRSKPFCPGSDASWLPPATGPAHAEHPLPCLCPTCLFGRGGQASPSVVAISQPIVIKCLVFSRCIVLLHCPFAPVHQSGSSILDGQRLPHRPSTPHTPP